MDLYLVALLYVKQFHLEPLKNLNKITKCLYTKMEWQICENCEG